MSLIENIKLSEGFRSRVYKCTEGYDTIGYGFAIKDLHMDEDIATMILERKVQDLKLKIQQKFPFIDNLPEDIQDVIIEMCFQLGITGFSRFKLTIKHFENKDYKAASKEMLNSKWAIQTPNRAKKLSNIVSSVASR
tara:strand:+ start:231 stop:641 length:411 start_codon:yes stop_codon:yes gene_type:complete